MPTPRKTRCLLVLGVMVGVGAVELATGATPVASSAERTKQPRQSGVRRDGSSYQVRLLEIPQTGHTAPQSINSRGDVAAMAIDTATSARAFVYRNKAWLRLQPLREGNKQYALAIDSAGDVVGMESDGHKAEAVRWKKLSPEQLGIADACALGAHLSGGVVGWANLDDTNRAFWLKGNALTYLPMPAKSHSEARCVNRDGFIVGVVEVGPAGKSHGFRFDHGRVTLLPDLSDHSSAMSVNDSGCIVGSSVTTKGDTHAVFWDKKGVHDLHTLGGTTSCALCINNRGEIVGFSDVKGDEPEHAILVRNHRMIDLNTLIPKHSGWLLEEARSINDKGAICGVGTYKGKPRRAFLLEPVPK